jgi:hypothetical protein
MASTFSITKADLTSAQYAIDTLTKGAAIEDDVARGIGVLRGLVTEGATIADLVAITGKSKSNIGRIRGIITLSAMLESDLPGDGIMRANKAVNAANKVTGLNFTKAHLNVWAKDGRRFGSWNAIADAVEAIVKGATEEQGEEPGEKTQEERFALLVAAVAKHGRKYGIDPVDVALDIVSALESAADADAAADAADLAA